MLPQINMINCEMSLRSYYKILKVQVSISDNKIDNLRVETCTKNNIILRNGDPEVVITSFAFHSTILTVERNVFS